MVGWEGTQQGQMTQADQRDIPESVASCSVHKGEEEEESRGIYGVSKDI